jgi:hypothetical protein
MHQQYIRLVAMGFSLGKNDPFRPHCAFFRSRSKAMLPKKPLRGQKMAHFSHNDYPSQQVCLKKIIFRYKF